MADVTELFEPYNVNHIRAYRELERTGIWPEETCGEKTWPEDTTFNPLWQVEIDHMLADAWVRHVLGED